MMYEYEVNYRDYTKFDKIVQEIAVKVADTTDKAIMEALCDYAKEYAREKEADLRMIIIDENAVEEIIKLGVEEYKRRECLDRFREMERGRNEEVGTQIEPRND